MALLLTALGAVLCSFIVSSEVVPQADFNLQEMAGKWYLVGFATNDQWFVDHRAQMKVGTAMLTPTADGDLDMSYASLNSDGSCWRLKNLAKKTDVSGKFTYTCQQSDTVNDMRVVDVKYDEYALIHTIKTKGSEHIAINKLYGRGVDLNANVLEKFRQFSLDISILPENIAFLPKNAQCPAPEFSAPVVVSTNIY